MWEDAGERERRMRGSVAPVDAFFEGVEGIVDGDAQVVEHVADEGLFFGGEGYLAAAPLVEGVAAKGVEEPGAVAAELWHSHEVFHLGEASGIEDGTVLAIVSTVAVSVFCGLGLGGETGIDDSDALFAVGEELHGNLTQAGVAPRAVVVGTQGELTRYFAIAVDGHGITGFC